MQGLRHRHVVLFAVAFAVAVPLLAPWAGPTRAFLLGFDVDARDGRHSEQVTKALSKVVPSSSIRRLIFGAYA